MAAIYSPAERGFDAHLEAVDRCQVALLRELASQHGSRLILKGGMAMRVSFGSMRLTKDIDFDREPTLSHAALKGALQKGLVRAASLSGIRQPRVQVTKDTSTTVRARLQGETAVGADIRFDVEVSGRGPVSAENIRSELVVPPRGYSIAPFLVATYSHEALAAMKIAAALAPQRHAARDLYDLRDLIRAGTDPTALLATQDRDLLEDFSARALGKLEMLTYPLAEQELLPYLPPAERAALTEDAWIEATLLVAERVQHWCAVALEVQAERSPPHRPPGGKDNTRRGRGT